MNWTDFINSSADVVVDGVTGIMLSLSFSRSPDNDVLRDLMMLNQKPGYKVFSLFENKYDISKPDGVKLSTLAPVVVSMLESHGLKVAFDPERLHDYS